MKTKSFSLRQAINDHCKWCIYDPLSGGGNWRQQVSACTITRCNLWPVRPLSSSGAKTPPEQTENAISDAI